MYEKEGEWCGVVITIACQYIDCVSCAVPGEYPGTWHPFKDRSMCMLMLKPVSMLTPSVAHQLYFYVLVRSLTGFMYTQLVLGCWL